MRLFWSVANFQAVFGNLTGEDARICLASFAGIRAIENFLLASKKGIG